MMSPVSTGQGKGAMLRLLALAGCVLAAAEKPNIWLIVADDLGFGDLGYTGSSIRTPNIDALAVGGNGTVLGHYYVMQCCSPTRSAIMTGRYNIRYGLQTQVIPNNKQYGLNLTEKTIPEHLEPLGYTSHALGKWHLGLWNWAYTPTFRGFSSFLGYYSGSQDYYKHTDSGFDLHLDVGKKCGPGCSVPRTDLNGNYSTLLYADRGVELVRNHDFDQGPMFMYAAFQSVHCPIQAPDKYIEPYKNLAPERQTFAGMLAALDEAIGKIADEFKARGVWDNTLVVFTTDNGGPVGAFNGKPKGIGCATGSQNWPLRGGKGAYFQGGVRGTAFVYGSMLHEAVRGTTTFELMSLTDLLPTFVEAGGGTPEGKPGMPLDGKSMWPYLTRNEGGIREDLLVNIEREDPTTAPGTQGCNGVGQYVAIKGRYKILLGGGGLPNTWYHDDLPYNGTDPVPQGGCLVACQQKGCLEVPYVQVYDVIADEAERNNLAPSNPDLVAELMQVVKKYNESKYVRALSIVTPLNASCPTYEGENKVLTPCPIPSASED